MSGAIGKNVTDKDACARVAYGISNTALDHKSGRGHAILCRLSPTVEELLELAKPEGESMASFLRTCALEHALRKLGDAQ